MKDKSTFQLEEKLTKGRMVKLAILASLVVVSALLLLAIFAQELWMRQAAAPGAQDRGYVTELGELCRADDESYGTRSIIFDKLTLSPSANGAKGYFLSFHGEINADGFSFRTEDPRAFGMDIYVSAWGDSKHFTAFERALSVALSEAELRFDGDDGEMRGRFTLVFSIDEDCFEHIKAKTSAKPEGFYQIELFPAIYWQGGENLFGFSASQVEYRSDI